MTNLNFDIDGIASLPVAIACGLIGYATDKLVAGGKSSVWLFLLDGSKVKISTTMTDTVGWREVGTLIFRAQHGDSDVPTMIPLQAAWNNVVSIEKLVVTDGDFVADSGLEIKNSLGEVFTIVCSANVYQIEIAAPFYEEEFLPEYEIAHYSRVPM